MTIFAALIFISVYSRYFFEKHMLPWLLQPRAAVVDLTQLHQSQVNLPMGQPPCLQRTHHLASPLHVRFIGWQWNDTLIARTSPHEIGRLHARHKGLFL